MPAQKAVARVPFNYGGVLLHRGEVFSIKEAGRNERLFGLKYIYEFDQKMNGEPKLCLSCGRNFVSDGARNDHKRTGCTNPQTISVTESRELVAEATGVDPGRVSVER